MNSNCIDNTSGVVIRELIKGSGKRGRLLHGGRDGTSVCGKITIYTVNHFSHQKPTDITILQLI